MQVVEVEFIQDCIKNKLLEFQTTEDTYHVDGLLHRDLDLSWWWSLFSLLGTNQPDSSEKSHQISNRSCQRSQNIISQILKNRLEFIIQNFGLLFQSVHPDVLDLRTFERDNRVDGRPADDERPIGRTNHLCHLIQAGCDPDLTHPDPVLQPEMQTGTI